MSTDGPAVAVGIAVTSQAARPTGRDNVAGSLLLGALGAFGHGAFFLAMDAASEGGVAWALLLARITSVTTLIVVLAARRQSPKPPRQWPALAGLGVLIVLADALYAIASTHAVVGVVAVLSSLYPVVTIVLARLILHEIITRGQWAGATLAAIGVAIIAAFPP